MSKYVYDNADVEVSVFTSDQLIGRVYDPEFAKQLLATDGLLLQPVLLTVNDGKLEVAAGRKRILHFQALSRMTKQQLVELDPTTMAVPDDFLTIPARIFHDISLQARQVWSLIENEQRSENIIQTWITMHQLQDAGDWDKIREENRFNKGRFARVSTLDNLVNADIWIAAFSEGKVAEATIMAIAKLKPARQAFVVDILNAKKKVTLKNVTEAKAAQIKSQMGAMPFSMAITAPAAITNTLYIVVDPQQLLMTNTVDGVGVDLVAMMAFKSQFANGHKLFKLVEVK